MGPAIKRFRPRAQGRASQIKRKISHINVILDEK
jgi:large subunit ribosomal protein L22